jgi:hypothetical protein
MTALGRLSCARGVNQHAPHHPGGRREEMRPVLPVNRMPVEQPDVGLLHEVRRLPPDGLALAREQPPSHVAKLAVDDWGQLGQGIGVTTAPCLQQPGHIGAHGDESSA